MQIETFCYWIIMTDEKSRINTAFANNYYVIN